MLLIVSLLTLMYLSHTVVTQNSFFFKRIMVPRSHDPDVHVDVFELTPDQSVSVAREENHRIDHDDHVVGRVLNMLQLGHIDPENGRDNEPGPVRRMVQLQRRRLHSGGPRNHQNWPNGVIPFIIDFPLRRIDHLIFSAMREIESKSCIKFKKRDNEPDFVLIRTGHGCFSGVGRKGGRQLVSLGHGCENFGIILHELMHVVGFYHLHQRHDRDKFLNIHWDNINPLFINNFKLLSPDVMPVNDFFDYQSIMMYGSASFSRDRSSVTMTPSRPGARIADPAEKSSLSAADMRVNDDTVLRGVCLPPFDPESLIPIMSYAARELNKLPVTEAVHRIKRHVRQHQELREDIVLGPTKNPPEGPNYVAHKDIDGKNPLEMDVSVDRNIAEVLVQTKRNFWTNKHELGALVTMTPSFLSPNLRKGFDSGVILLLAVVGGYSGHVVSKACAMMFTGGYRFFGHVVGMFLLTLFAAVILGTLILVNLWTEWRDAETCTDLFHRGKLVHLEDDEAAEVFKRLSWCHRNLEVYETVWLNRIIDKMWPKLRKMLTKMITKQLDHNHILNKVKEKTGGYLEISVLKTSIGHHPPRVSGVRVLDDRSRDVIIDTEITFDDEVDIGVEFEVRIYKFKPIVLSLGLRKFFLRLMMRVVVAPISSDLPLADSLTLFLMERPSLNWTFVGLGRILNLRFLQHMIEDVISGLLLYPKAIQVKLIREYLKSEPLDTEDPVVIFDLDTTDN